MKPLLTLLTIDSVGLRCISLEEGLEHNISNLNSVEEVIQYDFTTGYPEKITFTTE